MSSQMNKSCIVTSVTVLRVIFKKIRMLLLMCRKGCVGEKPRQGVIKKDEKGQNKYGY